MNPASDDIFRSELSGLKSAGLLRTLDTVTARTPRTITIQGREYVNFSSNDYLGFSLHPAVKAAAQAAVERFGTSAAASRAVTGNLALFEGLEARLAKLKDQEAALVFSAGYMANLGVITSLAEKGDSIIADRLNHASLVDACRLSGATLRTYPHADMKALEALLDKAAQARRRIVVTDALFSMDGDLAPLPEIAELCQRHNALLLVDDAHGTGVLGKTGTGALEHFGMKGTAVTAVIGTLSKALASQGGFVCASRTLIDYFVNRSRPFLFATGLCPAAVAAADTALSLLQTTDAVTRLKINVTQAEDILTLKRPVSTPILPVIIGEAAKAVAASQSLAQKGLWIKAMRPPTVKPGTARLRISVTAAHTREDLLKLKEVGRGKE